MKSSTQRFGWRRLALSSASLFFVGSLVSACGDGDDPKQDTDEVVAADATVEGVSMKTCTTMAVRGLAQQLVDEINCKNPNTLTSLHDTPGVELDDETFGFVQAPVANALKDAAAAAKTKLVVNSAIRTLPQQYLLTLWGAKRRCKIRLVARPGTSNHESGLAVDVANHGAMRATLTKAGSCPAAKQPKRACFQWKGAKDAVHFDYKGDGAVDLAGESIRAFQRLWTRNHPEDKLPETGAFDKATEARLKKSPAAGFPLGSPCTAGQADPIAAADGGAADGGVSVAAPIPEGVPPTPEAGEASEDSDE